MMSQTEFSTELCRAMRLVLQKHEREVLARAHASETQQHLLSSPYHSSEYLETKRDQAAAALNEANLNLDAALEQFANHLFQALEIVHEP
jgi:hypothetical protein